MEKKISIWSSKRGCLNNDVRYIALAMTEAVRYSRGEGERIEIFIDTLKEGAIIKSIKVFSLNHRFDSLGKAI